MCFFVCLFVMINDVDSEAHVLALFHTFSLFKTISQFPGSLDSACGFFVFSFSVFTQISRITTALRSLQKCNSILTLDLSVRRGNALVVMVALFYSSHTHTC